MAPCDSSIDFWQENLSFVWPWLNAGHSCQKEVQYLQCLLSHCFETLCTTAIFLHIFVHFSQVTPFDRSHPIYPWNPIWHQSSHLVLKPHLTEVTQFDRSHPIWPWHPIWQKSPHLALTPHLTEVTPFGLDTPFDISHPIWQKSPHLTEVTPFDRSHPIWPWHPIWLKSPHLVLTPHLTSVIPFSIETPLAMIHPIGCIKKFQRRHWRPIESQVIFFIT